MPNNWNRMGREDAWQTLDRLGSRRDAVIFSRETTEVSWRPLPFYGSYRLYRLVNYATMPVFTQYYLSNGIDFFPIDGSAEPVYEANARDRIHLAETTVIPYLDFFFANVQGSEGEVYIIKDPRRMPFIDSLSEEQRQNVVSSFRPLRVWRDEVKDALKVSGTIYYGGSLLSTTISVGADGRLTFEDQGLLLSGIHFPPEPFSQAWLEG
jgi:hypothetical protein